jgi:cytochrome c oxidase subunit 3
MGAAPIMVPPREKVTGARAITSEAPKRYRLAENGAFAMALFVFTEVMLFAGFISAFVIVKNSALPGMWPPPGQPRLPAGTTAFNTLALLVSGVLLFFAYRAWRGGRSASASRLMTVSMLLGVFFVVFQGTEWVALIRQGLTLTSSQLGAFFYVVVGAHALHATAALLALVIYWRAMLRNTLTASAFLGVQLFWYFVVLMWPVIYWKIYL